MDEIMTAQEVAELLKIHPRTLYKLAKAGEIPGVKIGGGWRFLRKDVMDLISTTKAGQDRWSSD